MQLVAYGAQDIYLTGNPQITFFKVVYRRHTNFSMESIKQTFNGNTDFGGDVSATISRNGDLVYRMYLEHDAVFASTGATATSNVGVAERYGDSLIKECEIEIGGQKIDKHTSMWNRVYSDLTQLNPSGHFGASVDPTDTSTAQSGNGTLYQLMTGNNYYINTAAASGDNCFGAAGTTVNSFTASADADASTIGTMTLNKIFIPLNFWFCRNPGLALPLIALQYHEVKVKMTFEQRVNLVRSHASSAGTAGTAIAFDAGAGNTSNFNLWCDYIYLDTDERRRFAQVSHEYLIEQLQFSENTVSNGSPSIDLNFNHPIKELIWCTRNEGTGGRCGGSNDGSAGTDPSAGVVSLSEMGGEWQLKLNGHDRFSERDSKYFTRTQVWQHHTGYGSLPTIGGNDTDSLIMNDVQSHGADSIAVYSFAIKPEEHQPSGTCNFSRIDNAQLVGKTITIEDDGGDQIPPAAGSANTKLTIFAVNYNVLRIMSGMGGLAYSN